MSNLFLPKNRSNPYRWNPYSVTRIKVTEWEQERVQSRINNAIAKSQGRNPHSVGGIEISEAAINEVRDTFSHPNSRLEYELLVHPEHRQAKADFTDLAKRVRNLIDCPTLAERHMSFRPEMVCKLLPKSEPEIPKPMLFSKTTSEAGPRGYETTLYFIGKALE